MSGVEFGIFLRKYVAEKGAVLLLVLEGGFEGSTLGGVSKGGLGVGVGSGELGTLRGLCGGGFFGGRVTDLSAKHFSVLAEEIHVGVATEFAGHGLDKSIRLNL